MSGENAGPQLNFAGLAIRAGGISAIGIGSNQQFEPLAALGAVIFQNRQCSSPVGVQSAVLKGSIKVLQARDKATAIRSEPER